MDGVKSLGMHDFGLRVIATHWADGSLRPSSCALNKASLWGKGEKKRRALVEKGLAWRPCLTRLGLAQPPSVVDLHGSALRSPNRVAPEL
jgi:hypothetical protein